MKYNQKEKNINEKTNLTAAGWLGNPFIYSESTFGREILI